MFLLPLSVCATSRSLRDMETMLSAFRHVNLNLSKDCTAMHVPSFGIREPK